ncbi:unnamed protein product [Haemonchus placei]|uniref:TFIIS N-terminal domain-containing protein n=1 Tax=Haemonchus placei TaxID=6290 RepID=A0A158QPY6_HAEPC|nr:unnamed protein product [Haemonchus placei]
MTKDDVLLYKVIKYGKLIKKKEKIAHVLSRLNDVEMTLDILSATNIGRYVNRLCDDPEYGPEASRIIEKWKEVARQSGVRGDEDVSSEGEESADHDPPTERMGLVNGTHEAKSRYRDDDTKRNEHKRERSDSRRSDSEMRDREKFRSRPDDDKKRHRSGSSRNEGNTEKSRSDSHRRGEEHSMHSGDEDDERRRRHRDEYDRRSSCEGSKPNQVGQHKSRHHDGNDRKRKVREAEEENHCKRKAYEGVRTAGSDYDDHSDAKYKNSGRDSYMAPERVQGESSDDHGRSDDFSGRTDDEDVDEDAVDEKGDSSPSNRQSSSRSEKSHKSGPSYEGCTQKSSKPKSHSSSSSKSKSEKSSERNKVATDFEMMLQSADTTPTKSRKPRDPHWKWAEMPLLNNYQPFPQALPQALRPANKTPPPPQDDFNPENMFKPRNERGKVFAGRRKVTTISMPSLFNLCLRVLANNTRVLYYADYINYEVLKPVLEKCDAETLAHIESKHDYLEEDTGELWQRFVTKKYPGEEPDDGDSWKDFYAFLEKEREKKLKLLSQRIGKHHQADSAKAPRKAMLADAAAPSYIRRRQIQHGTLSSKPLPSAIEVSHARRKIFETGGCKDALAALPKAVVNKNSTVGAKMNRDGPKKPPAKKGALMIKTMKMLNMKRK